MEVMITDKYLLDNPDHIFVFGDNLKRAGRGGAAKLRHHKNTYGFITKKAPTHNPEDYYRPGEYGSIMSHEVTRLLLEFKNNPEKTYLISKLGAGLANKYNIWEELIRDMLERLRDSNKPNVKFLYDKGA